MEVRMSGDGKKMQRKFSRNKGIVNRKCGEKHQS